MPTTEAVVDSDAPATEAPAITTTGVSQRYGDTEVLHGVDLNVESGTVFGFIGPSGSGKTTTIRLLTGIEAPTSGEVRVLGEDPFGCSSRHRARLGYLPQASVLFPSLSLRQNLSFAAGIYGRGWPRKQRIRDVLELVELWEHRSKRLADASGGMQRRLALAAALVHDPEVCFLDEPTAGIDPVLRRSLWEAFDELRQRGRTLFVTTQYVSEAAYCDRVGVLSDGQLIAVDTPDGLRRRAFGGDVVRIAADDAIQPDTLSRVRALDGVTGCERDGDDRHLRLVVERADAAIPAVTDWFDDQGTRLASVREDHPPFEDVFVALIESDRAQPEGRSDDAVPA